MSSKKTDIQIAIGKLISAIQKEWNDQLGVTPAAKFTEEIMYSAHDLLKAKTIEDIKKKLGKLSLKQYLGETWIKSHPRVKYAIDQVEKCLNNDNS